jgi:23S rRNA pseudouridine955/2504/2580 synthase
MSLAVYHIIDASSSGQRLDNYLLRVLKDLPRPYVYRLIRSGQLRVNKKRSQPSYRLNIDDCLRFPPFNDLLDALEGKPPSLKELSPAVSKGLEESFLYEDSDFLVVNKAPTMASHGGTGLSYGLIEALRLLRSDPHLALAHRLDQGTSGCILIAKNRQSLINVQEQFKERRCIKRYWALLEGNLAEGQKIERKESLEKYQDHHDEKRVRVSDGPFAKEAHSSFEVLLPLSGATFVECTLHTGRAHQIRVHSAFMNHPVIGDEKYGNHYQKRGLCLHARSLSFQNRQGKWVECLASLPEHWKKQEKIYVVTEEQRKGWDHFCAL